MSLEAYWRQYDRCPQCGAAATQPCIDMRLYTRFNDTAHRGRRKTDAQPQPLSDPLSRS